MRLFISVGICPYFIRLHLQLAKMILNSESVFQNFVVRLSLVLCVNSVVSSHQKNKIPPKYWIQYSRYHLKKVLRRITFFNLLGVLLVNQIRVLYTVYLFSRQLLNYFVYLATHLLW